MVGGQADLGNVLRVAIFPVAPALLEREAEGLAIVLRDQRLVALGLLLAFVAFAAALCIWTLVLRLVLLRAIVAARAACPLLVAAALADVLRRVLQQEFLVEEFVPNVLTFLGLCHSRGYAVAGSRARLGIVHQRCGFRTDGLLVDQNDLHIYWFSDFP